VSAALVPSCESAAASVFPCQKPLIAIACGSLWENHALRKIADLPENTGVLPGEGFLTGLDPAGGRRL